MGFLLLQYEYQRACSKVEVYERTGMRLNNKLNTLTTRISKMEKEFDKQKNNIETKWQSFSNTASAQLSSVGNAASTLAPADAQSAIEAQLNGIVIGHVRLGSLVDCSSIGAASTGTTTGGTSGASAVLTAINTVLGQAKAMMAELINMIKEQQTELLDEQENQQMAPISSKQMDIQADKNLADTLCEEWKTRKEKSYQHLGEAVKDSMAGFGLGGR